MKIRTRNIDQNIITNHELKVAVDYYLSLMLPRHRNRNIELSISMAPLDIKGYIEWVDKPVKPRKFRMVLNSLYKKKQTLLTLAHECVHLKQYVLDELRDASRNTSKWKKESFDIDKVHYYDHPWETEAYGREWGLYVRYMESLGGAFYEPRPKTSRKKGGLLEQSSEPGKVINNNDLLGFLA